MKNKVLRILNILTGALLLSTFHCLIMEVIGGAGSANILTTLIYIPIITILSLGEKKVKHGWQYLICVGIAFAIPYFGIEPSFLRSVMLVLIVIAAISYFVARAWKMSCWLDKAIYYGLIIYFGVYLMGIQSGSDLLKMYGMIGAGIYYLLCLYQNNISEIEKFVWVNEKVERVPVKRIYHSSYLMMGMQTVIVVVGMIVLPFLQVGDILTKIMQTITNTIGWLLRGLETDEVLVGAEAAEQTEMVLVQESGEVSWLMELLYEIMDKISEVIVIAITLYILYVALKKLYQLYLDFDARSEEVGDKIERLNTPKAKDEKKKLKKQRTENLFWDRTPNARIRKYYKKRVLKELKTPPKASMTPEEIEAGFKNVDMEETSILHSCYEKARYGNEACTKEELKCVLK